MRDFFFFVLVLLVIHMFVAFIFLLLQPRDANLEESLCNGRVLLIHNVDPFFTSKDMHVGVSLLPLPLCPTVNKRCSGMAFFHFARFADLIRKHSASGNWFFSNYVIKLGGLKA